ncbi:cytochrome c [Tateyamaria sp. syn59]|uniref:c-type cytochrome n=1 Tax=Tateyamaria sp. syn59 TaxID=2576942 RepID=UPI0011BFE0D7|nr:cytochrome c [Tateyamaria sp. syn59]
MNRTIRPTVAGLGLSLCATFAAAQGFTPEMAQETRERHMHVMAAHLGLIGAMAKGEAEYDAGVARSAAEAISALAETSGTLYWVRGSSSEDLEDSRALPALWQDMESFDTYHEDLVAAAAGMESAAGTDLAALRAAMGPLGKVCSTCHEDFRKPEE